MLHGVESTSRYFRWFGSTFLCPPALNGRVTLAGEVSLIKGGQSSQPHVEHRDRPDLEAVPCLCRRQTTHPEKPAGSSRSGRGCHHLAPKPPTRPRCGLSTSYSSDSAFVRYLPYPSIPECWRMCSKSLLYRGHSAEGAGSFLDGLNPQAAYEFRMTATRPPHVVAVLCRLSAIILTLGGKQLLARGYIIFPSHFRIEIFFPLYVNQIGLPN